MKKAELDNLIKESVREQKIENFLRKLVSESISEIKDEEKVALSDMQDELSDILDRKNGKTEVIKNKNVMTVEIYPKHSFKIEHMFNDVFNLTYIKDSTDRLKKTNIKFDDLKKLIKTFLDKIENYVESARKKVDDNRKYAEGSEKKTPDVEKTKDDQKQDLPYEPVSKRTKSTGDTTPAHKKIPKKGKY